MPLTKDFGGPVARAARDPDFRAALFQKAMQTLLDGEISAGRAVVRDYINATVGFGKLNPALGRSPKSLMRMFGPGGKPTAANLFSVIGVCRPRRTAS
jgi:hypothetical protein